VIILVLVLQYDILGSCFKNDGDKRSRVKSTAEDTRFSRLTTLESVNSEEHYKMDVLNGRNPQDVSRSDDRCFASLND
jgi:hypothetical protein